MIIVRPILALALLGQVEEPPTPPKDVSTKKASSRLTKRTKDTQSQPKDAKAKEPKTEDLDLPKRNIPAPEERPKQSDLDRELLKDLGKNLEKVDEEEADPLLRVGRRMRTVEENLARLDGSDDTVETQKKIVQDFDDLLKQLSNPNNQSKKQKQEEKDKKKQKQMQQQQAQKQQGQDNSPSKQSASQAGKASVSREQRPTDLREVKDVWGHLSALMREEMDQYAKDKFLPKYRELLEKYYETIAEQSRSKE